MINIKNIIHIATFNHQQRKPPSVLVGHGTQARCAIETCIEGSCGAELEGLRAGLRHSALETGRPRAPAASALAFASRMALNTSAPCFLALPPHLDRQWRWHRRRCRRRAQGTRGNGRVPSGPTSSAGACLVARSRQARPEEAPQPKPGTAKGCTSALLTCGSW